MKNRFCKMLALLTCMVMALLALCAGTAAAEKYTEFLGKPFPEFTATDTEGKTFTLSEALKDHEAVLVNLWATWCGPCLMEFPYLSEVYQKYSDRVAFIALSVEPKNTMEDIAEYRKENNVALPMGRDEGEELYQYIRTNGIPDTVVIDRFGNAVFFHVGAFKSAGDVERVLDTFLGDSYTKTTVLESIPRDASTQAFPVSAARALYPEDGNYKKALIHVDGLKNPIACWFIPDESVIIRAEVAADDDVPVIMYEETYGETDTYLKDMLDPNAGTYIIEQIMPKPGDEYQFVKIALFDSTEEESSEKDIVSFLVKDEDGLNALVEGIKSEAGVGVSWEYAEEKAPAESALQAYIIHVVDQDNKPVGEVAVNFCTDTACTPSESDENGTVTFSGAPDVYHVQIVDVPEGYSWDESYDMYTTREYGEWILRVRKD